MVRDDGPSTAREIRHSLRLDGLWTGCRLIAAGKSLSPRPGRGDHFVKIRAPRLPAKNLVCSRCVCDQDGWVAGAAPGVERRDGNAGDPFDCIENFSHRSAATSTEINCA